MCVFHVVVSVFHVVSVFCTHFFPVKLHVAFWSQQSERFPRFGNPQQLHEDVSTILQSSSIRSDYSNLEMYRLLSHAQVALFDIQGIDLKAG